MMEREDLCKDDFVDNIVWNYRMPLIKNAVMWRDILLALGIPVVLLGLFLLFLSGGEDIVMIIMAVTLIALILAALAIIAVIILFILYRGGVEMTFSLNEKGIGYEAGKRSRDINKGLAMAGAMSGSPTAAGAGMLAASRDSNFIKWEDVGSVKIHRRQRVIYVRSKMLIDPIALYCTHGNFHIVEDMVRSRVNDTKIS